MDKITHLLADPITLESLKLVSNTLISGGGGFPIVNGVPDFTTSEEQQSSHNSIHFDYVTHYQYDASTFNYFEEPNDPATVHENTRLHQAITARLSKHPGKILDVGCGGAWFAAMNLHRQEMIISFDVALKNTQEALRRYPAKNHFAVAGDALRLPFQSKTFDAVVSAEVIEHVASIDTFLDSLIRVVKPGGRVIISTPYNETIERSLCIHCNKLTPRHAHLHSFQENSLDDWLAKNPDIELETFSFSNKALLFARTHVLLKHLPYSFWQLIDSVTNFIIPKPSRLIFTLTKSVNKLTNEISPN